MGGRSRPVFDYDKKRRAEMKALSAIPSYGILGTYTTPVAGTPTQYIARQSPVAPPVDYKMEESVSEDEDELDYRPRANTRGSSKKKKGYKPPKNLQTRFARKAKPSTGKTRAKPSDSAKARAQKEYRKGMAGRQRMAEERSKKRKARTSASDGANVFGQKKQFRPNKYEKSGAKGRVPVFPPRTDSPMADYMRRHNVDTI